MEAFDAIVKLLDGKPVPTEGRLAAINGEIVKVGRIPKIKVVIPEPDRPWTE